MVAAVGLLGGFGASMRARTLSRLRRPIAGLALLGMAACLPKTEETPDDAPCTTLDWLFGGECSTSREDSGGFSDSGWGGWDTGSFETDAAACRLESGACVSGAAVAVQSLCAEVSEIGANAAVFSSGGCDADMRREAVQPDALPAGVSLWVR